jgi:hypothetical protein
MLLYVLFVVLLFYLPLAIAALSPALAVWHFSWGKRSPSIAAFSFVVFLLPVAISVLLRESTAHLDDRRPELAYVLWFFPGLMLLLHGYGREKPYVSTRASLFYLGMLALMIVPSMFVGYLAIPALTAVAAIVYIIACRDDESMKRRRQVGCALLLLPLVVSLVVRLPANLDLAGVCRWAAGSEFPSVSTPVSVLAVDYADVGCRYYCFSPLQRRKLAAMEVGADGWSGPRYPAGPHRYEMAPLAKRGSLPVPPQVGPESCIENRGGTGACLVATPIEAYSAEFLLRLRDSVSTNESISEESFEIVDRGSGNVVAWTSGFYLEESEVQEFLDIPFALVTGNLGKCANNGPRLNEFIETFAKASQAGASQ